MIAVKMAKDDDIQTPRVEAGTFHREQRRWAAIQQKQSVAGFDQITALVAAAVAKSITATENMESHGGFYSFKQQFFSLTPTNMMSASLQRRDSPFLQGEAGRPGRCFFVLVRIH